MWNKPGKPTFGKKTMSNTGKFSRRNKNRPFRPGKTRHFSQSPQSPAPTEHPDRADNVMHVGADAIIEDTAATQQQEMLQEAEAIPVPDDEPPADPGQGEKPQQQDLPAAFATELEKLREERDTYLEMARRERADFDNYRKRVEREKQQIMKDSLAGFLKEFFTPLDDMDRVLNQSSKDQSFESLLEGVRLMEENFWRVFAKVGVRRIDALGKPFDPVQHEAMAAVPAPGVEPNTVLEVFQNGYKIDDHILRPARVIVSRAAE